MPRESIKESAQEPRRECEDKVRIWKTYAFVPVWAAINFFKSPTVSSELSGRDPRISKCLLTTQLKRERTYSHFTRTVRTNSEISLEFDRGFTGWCTDLFDPIDRLRLLRSMPLEREGETRVGSRWSERLRVSNRAEELSRVLGRVKEVTGSYTNLERAFARGKGRKESSHRS